MLVKSHPISFLPVSQKMMDNVWFMVVDRNGEKVEVIAKTAEFAAWITSAAGFACFRAALYPVQHLRGCALEMAVLKALTRAFLDRPRDTDVKTSL
jgi:hypothetical protein